MAATPAALPAPAQSAARFISDAVALKTSPRRADERDGDHRLQERRQKRHHRAAPERAFVGEHVGRDQRLAVAGPGGVKDAIGEAEADQSPGGARIAMQRMDLRRHEMGELATAAPCSQPVIAALRPAAAFAAADGERPRAICASARAAPDRQGGAGQTQRSCKGASSWARDDGARSPS